VPRQSFDVAENLPKETPCQVALGQLQDKVSGVPNEAATGLEEPLLETRQRPALNAEPQDQPAQEVAEVIGDDPEQEADLVGPEPVAGEPGPVDPIGLSITYAGLNRYMIRRDPLSFATLDVI
jgi:hypothetical protein